MSVLGAFLIAMLIVIPTLNPPEKDIYLLFIFMSGTGLMTTGLAYLLFHQGAMQWFNSLRWTLLATIVLTVMLIFVNVWLTAQLMFISNHDLILTTALLVFASVISVVSVFFISGTLIERIHALGTAAERLAKGDLKSRVVLRGNDELAQLAETFNFMAERLQQVDEQKRMLEQTRRDLIAWASHDLRTPLAAIRAMNEAIMDGVVNDAETTQRYMQNIQKEVQHLSHLIDDLFELTQLDTGRIKMARELASLNDLISDAISGMAAQARHHNIHIMGHINAEIDLVEIAPDKIQRVLHNLLDNAIRHTPPGGDVTLQTCREANLVRVSVHNTGSVIADSDLPHIFESFYRGERSRVQRDGGSRSTGLGLAIAKGFVEAHGGKMWVESSAEQGTTFSFSLPA